MDLWWGKTCHRRSYRGPLGSNLQPSVAPVSKGTCDHFSFWVFQLTFHRTRLKSRLNWRTRACHVFALRGWTMKVMSSNLRHHQISHGLPQSWLSSWALSFFLLSFLPHKYLSSPISGWGNLNAHIHAHTRGGCWKSGVVPNSLNEALGPQASRLMKSEAGLTSLDCSLRHKTD